MGALTSNHNIAVGSSWTTGTQTPNIPTDPVFNPTLEWLRAATQWIDLPASASWGTRQTGVCTMTPAQLITLMATAGGPLVIDLTPCPNNATPFTGAKLALSISNMTLRRDVVVLSPAGKKLEVALGGTVAGSDRQLFLVHVDTDADHLPTCGNGNAQDQFDVSGPLPLICE